MKLNLFSKYQLFRIVVILCIGSALVYIALLHRQSKRPHPVPPQVQIQGQKIIESIIQKISSSEFGKSLRCRILVETIQNFRKRGAIIFSAEINNQGQYWHEISGQKAIYVKVFSCGRSSYSHQPEDLIGEAIFHEAVHAIKTNRIASTEEECDGYCAGILAGIIIRGDKIPEVFILDGIPTADFVLKCYKNNPRDSGYVPIGETREWLYLRTGLR